MVLAGLTEIAVPVTAPIPLIDRVGAGAPLTDQDKVVDPPAVTTAGFAVNEEMTGALVEALTVTMVVAWTVPVELEAVKV